jgi:tetratricopeptide (TPR) repeat protein
VRPAWSDEILRYLCRHIRSRLFFAHVRATTGTPVTRPNCHPFACGRWMFMHNGVIGDWRRVRRQVEALIPDEFYGSRVGTTDSEAVFLAIMGAGIERDPIAGAIAEFQRAFVLNPNYLDHRYTDTAGLILAGEPARALEVLEAGIRLDPFSWIPVFCQMGLANFLLKRYGEAVRLCGECASRLPNLQTPHLFLAAAYAQLGQLEEAKAEAAQVADQPRFHN